MANKVFGSEFPDSTNPIGTETTTIFNGTSHVDVTLRDFIYKVIANAQEEFSVHDDDNLALLDSQSVPINAPRRVEFSTIWTWIAGKIPAALGPIVAALTGKTTPVDADETLLADSAASGASKKLTMSNLKTYVNTGNREVLTGNRTYYVRTDGSDSNNGLTNNSGGAFLTIQKAIDVVASIDIRTFNVVIQVADGTYTGAVLVNGQWLGSGVVTIQGNSGTPANVHINVASGNYAVEVRGGILTIKDLKITNGGAYGLAATNAGRVEFSNIVFGSASSAQIRAETSGFVLATGNYSISAGAAFHYNGTGGTIRVAGVTVTLTGTPAFSTAFAHAQLLGSLITFSITFSGSATGKRYDIATNSVAFTNGGGASFYPGSVAGTTATGGQYV